MMKYIVCLIVTGFPRQKRTLIKASQHIRAAIGRLPMGNCGLLLRVYLIRLPNTSQTEQRCHKLAIPGGNGSLKIRALRSSGPILMSGPLKEQGSSKVSFAGFIRTVPIQAHLTRKTRPSGFIWFCSLHTISSSGFSQTNLYHLSSEITAHE